MATSFLKEYLLSQLCKLGINPCPTKEEEKPVVVKQTLVEAGYCPHIPTDNVPIAFLPAMLRLDKQSWLNALSIEANFSTDVEDGDLVCPRSVNNSKDFISNIAELRDSVWVPVNRVDNTASTDEDTPRIWGIAYKHVGRVMFGPLVFHHRFSFKTGDILYVGESGSIVKDNTGVVLGICLAPGSIFIDLSVSSSKLALEALEETVDGLKNSVEDVKNSLGEIVDAVNSIQRQLNDKLGVGDDVSSNTVTASGSDTARELADRFADVINVKDFGAKGDMETDDTAAIQAAIDHGRIDKRLVFLPSGTYLISSPIIVYKNTTILGASLYNTIIKLKDNSNCNVIETYKFSSFYATGGDNVSDYPDLPVNFSIENITIDGNRNKNYNGIASQANTGCGILIYGRSFIVNNIFIHDCAGNGFHSALRHRSINHEADTIDDFNKSYITNIFVKGTSFEGFIFEGSADIFVNNILVGECHYPNATTAESAIGSSLVFPGESIDGIVFDSYDPDDDGPVNKSAGTAEIGFIHAYSCLQGYCVRFSGSSTRINADNVHAEGGIGCLYVTAGVKGNINKISTRNNQYGAVSLQRPFVDIYTSSGLHIGAIAVNKSATDVGARSGIIVNSRYVSIDCVNIIGGRTPGHGLVVNSISQISKVVCNYMHGETSDNDYSVGIIIGNTALTSTIGSIDIIDCDIAILCKSDNLPSILGGGITRTNGANVSQDSQQIVFEKSPNIYALKNWGITLNDKGTYKFSKFSGYVVYDSDNSGEVQTLSVDHKMWRTPKINEIQLGLWTSDLALHPVYYAVKEVSATTVTLLVNCPSGATSRYNILVNI